ncbi:molybdopterin cofactor-binding domain-containing protein [Oceanicoccus sp. KOV_DT_Chl]|uniref:xanthine dehydrogenase family protein molybdopterin-binding subunit n=1 Tax=Oceanicoccus sp. KOV_DT_Chl TaxID=1904639 RepID=UPI000C7C6243|nr:molybdopterin cofactor-binding domain-containing protein [Oceanicoccus sp. KOV_DT_Chl]
MLSRRQLIKLTMLTSGSMLVTLPLRASAQKPIAGDTYINAYLEITAGNELIFSMDKVEMGQGVINSLVAILAEEIDTDPATITVTMPVVGADQKNPWFRPSWGTGASTSVRSSWADLRMAGATLKQRMLIAAAQQWGLKASQLRCENAAVITATGKRASFAELASVAANVEPSTTAIPKTAADYRWVGHKIPSQDIALKSTGQARYGFDTPLPPQTAIAICLRSPNPEGKISSWQWRKQPDSNSVQVLEFENYIALVGRSFFELQKIRQDIEIEWTRPRTLPASNDELKKRLYTSLSTPAEEVFKQGSFIDSTGNGQPQDTVSANYYVPYLAHAPMEPMNCTVLIDNGQWTLWAATQKPPQALSIAEKISGISREHITVNVPYIGGAFGRRLRLDYVTEACQVAKRLGRSVQVLWSREDDFQHCFYRPAAAARLSAKPTLQSIDQFDYQATSSEPGPARPQHWLDKIQHEIENRWQQFRGMPTQNGQAIEGVHETPYQISGQRIAIHYADIGFPTGPWRSVGNSISGFFTESFIDELAWQLKQDPLLYRQQLLTDPALKKVLNTVAELSHWKHQSPPGKGVATYRCFGTAVAMVVESQWENENLKVTNVWCAIDCGLVIDPDGVKKQVEGSIMYGLCAALYGDVTIEKGQIASSNFHDYPVLRIDQAPKIEVALVASDRPPSGVGEPATPLIAPALCNALFSLTGKRIRELPIMPHIKGLG